jgi:glutamate 5-kinase
VRNADGRALAQGLVEYSSDEVARIMGRKSEELEALLGYAPRAAVIHRDQLVLL